MCFSSLKSFFIYFKKDLSSNFYFWICKNFKKIKALWKFYAFFVRKFFLFFFKSVGKNEQKSHFNFFRGYMFSDLCLKNHKILICHFLSTFLKILWKFSANQVQFFLLVVFWILHKFVFGIYLVFVFQPMERSSCFTQENIGSELLMKLTTLVCNTG
jgi:hypothetical protein